MRVAHLSTYDVAGGAARSAHRLHRTLRAQGVESAMFVRSRASDDPDVRHLGSVAATVRAWANAGALLPYRRRAGMFTAAPIPDRTFAAARAWNADVVALHWVAEGFVSPRSLAAARLPIAWTLHDSYAFTGGCHCPLDCRRYTERCGACPVLGSTRERDLSRLVWSRKRRSWRGIDLTVVTPSEWLASCARASSLFHDVRIEVIPNGIDLEAFRPIPREVARELLRLPLARKYVLFSAVGGATSPIKGFVHLAAALRTLASARAAEGVELLIAGTSTPPAVDCGVPVRCMGVLHDDVSIALLNAAADVVAVPSISENFPNTALEAIACGRPVAAFRIGGIPELVADRKTGALAEPFEPADLARALRWTFDDADRWSSLSAEARRTAEARYSVELQARRYAELYGELAAPARNPAPSRPTSSA